MNPSAVGRPSDEAIRRRKRDLYIASFSDVHFGHRKTPTASIIDHLDRFGFPDNAETGELDLILLGGDLFDEGLMYFEEDIRLIELWMYRLLRLCEKRHIVLRVLEGTPSHDRKQSAHFEKILAMHPMDVDFRYVTQIEVEDIASLGISVLFVPDFTGPDAEKIWAEVKRAMKDSGHSRVDYANIHGAFSYQLPPIAAVQKGCHDMTRYLGIVDNYIFTGHIHKPSIYDRILCNGSFDRLGHGEEEDKGHWRAFIGKDGQDRFVFRINQAAKQYVTLDLTTVPVEEAHARVESAASLPKGSAVRLQLDRHSPILTTIPDIKKAYPFLEWSVKTEDRTEAQKNLLVDLRGEFKEVQMTPTNAVTILTERLMARPGHEAYLDRALALLKEYIHA